MANENQDDLILAADTVTPVQLQQDEYPKSCFQKISEFLQNAFIYITAFLEATIVLIVFAVIMYYHCGVSEILIGVGRTVFEDDRRFRDTAALEIIADRFGFGYYLIASFAA